MMSVYLGFMAGFLAFPILAWVCRQVVAYHERRMIDQGYGLRGLSNCEQVVLTKDGPKPV